jgi:DNA-binding NarL/FixJ family response regulator
MTGGNGLCRVVVVDDDKLVRDLLSAVLSNLDAEVVGTAEDGEEALTVFEELAPDIIFLDIQMPRKNGIETLKDILAKHPDAYVVMLTATSDMDVANECISTGAKNFIRKGAPPDVLNIMLKSHIDLFTPN